MQTFAIVKDKVLVEKNIGKLVEIFKKNDKQIYLVGGSLRDILMGKTPKDWDFATNAAPEEIVEMIEGEGIRAVYENNFGTVCAVFKDSEDNVEDMFEITPYRKDGKYSDGRHPDKIEFANTVEEDLSRRDFTINAMALNLDTGEVKDLFGGLEDIKGEVIRAVGNPEERFEEDILRVMRAIRFASQLGFYIENETFEAIKKTAKDIKRISIERIRDEFLKIIMSQAPDEGIRMLDMAGILKTILPELSDAKGVDQSRSHIYDVYNHLLASLKTSAEQNLPLHIRLSALFHDIGKPATRRKDEKNNIYTFYGHEVVGAKMVKKITERFKFEKTLAKKVVKLVRWHMFFSDPDKISLSAVRRLLREVGEELIWDLIELRKCDRGGMRKKLEPYRLRAFCAMIEEVLSDPVSVKQLKINGDIMIGEYGFKPGKKMGYILHILLDEVIEDPQKNNKEYLGSRALELKERDYEELSEMASEAKKKIDNVESLRLEEIKNKYRVK